MRRCPLCTYIGIPNSIKDKKEGYLLNCPKCNKTYNEDDYEEELLFYTTCTDI